MPESSPVRPGDSLSESRCPFLTPPAVPSEYGTCEGHASDLGEAQVGGPAQGDAVVPANPATVLVVDDEPRRAHPAKRIEYGVHLIRGCGTT
jgi:hypothetical protein